MTQSGFLPRLNDVDEFRDLCVEYAEQVRKAGVEVVPFAHPDMLLYRSLPENLQKSVLRAIRADIEIFQSITREGFALRDTPHHLWRYLSSMKVTPESDLFDKIEKTDLVELYAMDGDRYSQLFRNLRVLEFLSFTLEQMFGMDWRFGVRRKPSDEQLLSNYGQKFFSGALTTTLAIDQPAHVVQEVGSVLLNTFLIKIKYLSPVRLNGQVFGLISVHSCELLGRNLGHLP